MGWIFIIFPFIFVLIIFYCFILDHNKADDGENYATDMEGRNTKEPDIRDEVEHCL